MILGCSVLKYLSSHPKSPRAVWVCQSMLCVLTCAVVKMKRKAGSSHALFSGGLLFTYNCKLQIELQKQKQRSKVMEGKKTELLPYFSPPVMSFFLSGNFGGTSYVIPHSHRRQMVNCKYCSHSAWLCNVFGVSTTQTCEYIECVCLHLFTQRWLGYRATFLSLFCASLLFAWTEKV